MIPFLNVIELSKNEIGKLKFVMQNRPKNLQSLKSADDKTKHGTNVDACCANKPNLQGTLTPLFVAHCICLNSRLTLFLRDKHHNKTFFD